MTRRPRGGDRAATPPPYGAGMTLIQDLFTRVHTTLGTEGAVANCRRELDRREAEQREVAALAARLACRPSPALPARRSA